MTASFIDRLAPLVPPAMPVAWVQHGQAIAVIDRRGDVPAADIIAALKRAGVLSIDTRVILRGRRGLWDELLHDGRDLTAVLMIGAETIDDALRASEASL